MFRKSKLAHFAKYVTPITSYTTSHETLTLSNLFHSLCLSPHSIYQVHTHTGHGIATGTRQFIIFMYLTSATFAMICVY